MAELIFKGFLPQENKPEKFEKFREIANEIYKTVDGTIVFSWIEILQQFDIIENNTTKDNIELKSMLGINSPFLI